jgi:hypothetical protein
MKFFELSSNEKGGVFVEAALTIPFLIYVMFMGFELTRLSELQLVRRDISRVLSLTHTCAFKQNEASQNCYNNAIRSVSRITSLRFPDTKFYIQNYAIDSADIANRNSKCSSYGSAKTLRIVKNSSSSPTIPSDFDSKYGFKDERTSGTLGDIIPQGDDLMAKQLCSNGQITIAEFNLKRQPMFAFILDKLTLKSDQNGGRKLSHYEFGAI